MALCVLYVVSVTLIAYLDVVEAVRRDLESAAAIAADHARGSSLSQKRNGTSLTSTSEHALRHKLQERGAANLHSDKVGDEGSVIVRDPETRVTKAAKPSGSWATSLKRVAEFLPLMVTGTVALGVHVTHGNASALPDWVPFVRRRRTEPNPGSVRRRK
eukprot:TRINITY_DN7807_c0_g1_i2.p1 TRINITY_DN7807_c0_g1~~TRINITY_DN7807_c0_g1_i2.p1  ORF type:complete len:159 (+),score=12.86 TRINITY_DN7807_c0_g1_i2:108-584(+)